MRHASRRDVEVETLAEFDRRVADGVRSLAGWQLQGLDLRERRTKPVEVGNDRKQVAAVVARAG